MRGALVLGASGLVGGALWETLKAAGNPVVGTSRSGVTGLVTLDLADAARLVAETAPSVVYNAAGRPNVDECEERPAETRAVNCGPLPALAEACAAAGARLVHFSTDYVFDGTAGPYSETDATNPISEYGRQKLEAERLIAGHGKDWLILRTTVVFGHERAGKNFVARLVRELSAGRPLRVPHDQLGSPTYAPDLAEAAVALAAKGASGIVDACGPEVVARSEFAKSAARAFGLDPALIVPVTTAELGQRAARPLKAGMRTEKLRGLLGRGLPRYEDALKRMAQLSS